MPASPYTAGKREKSLSELSFLLQCSRFFVTWVRLRAGERKETKQRGKGRKERLKRGDWE
jgi:hypothetical protein